MKTSFRATIAAVLTATAALAQTATAPTGAISGIALQDGKTPVAGITIRVVSIPTGTPPPSRYATLVREAVTGSDGGFNIAGLPAATFQICAHPAPGASLLDPCLWSSAKTTIALAAGQQARQNVSLATGRLQKLHLVDQGGLIAANEGKVAGAGMIVAIGGDVNILTPFNIDSTASTASTSRDQSLAIPFNTALKLVVHSDFYKIVDVNGNDVSNSFVMPLAVAPTDPNNTIQLTITGKK